MEKKMPCLAMVSNRQSNLFKFQVTKCDDADKFAYSNSMKLQPHDFPKRRLTFKAALHSRSFEFPLSPSKKWIPVCEDRCSHKNHVISKTIREKSISYSSNYNKVAQYSTRFIY